MKLEELRRDVLLTLKGREEYGYNIAKMLSSRGNNIHLGYIYETLKEMEAEKIVQSRWEKGIKGPKRKVYSLTRRGEIALQDLLAEAIEIIHYFYGAYLSSLPPEKNVIQIIFQAVNNIFPLKKARVLVYVITDAVNPAVETAIRGIQKQAENVTLYLIKPQNVEVILNLPNFVVLSGTPDDVPLKNSFADGIVLESFCSTNISGIAKEVRRVIKPSGVAVFLSPHLQLEEAQDPLGIGAYIEKMEYELSRQTEIVRRTLIEEEISKYFTIVDVLKAGPLTAFISKLRIMW